jgi:uncharacterized protein with FMN-binding domain
MKKGWKVLIIIVVIVAVLAAGGAIAMRTINGNLEKLADMPVADIDLAAIPDGTYAGQYTCFPVAVEVEVTVADHAITDIVLVKHQNGQGGAAEVLPERVVAAQSLRVDTVSGATYSSKVILKAIEDALK